MKSLWRIVIAGALAVLLGIIAVLVWLVIDQRRTSAELRSDLDTIIDAFEVASEERATAMDNQIAAFEADADKHRDQTDRDLDVVIRSLKEILRQIGGDPSRIPPQARPDDGASSNGGDRRNGGGGGDPDPDPDPDPEFCTPETDPLPTVCIDQ